MAVALGTATPALADDKPDDKAVSGWSDTPQPKPAEDKQGHKDRVPAEQRAKVLGSQYKKSDDLAWTTTGDATGFHLLVAKEAEGYRWKTAATLSEPGFFDTDTWIGNACVTGSGKYALVAYAPRTFTNEQELMARGAFTAAVDLTNGKVTKLRHQGSLAYFSPGCGAGDEGVISQYTDEKTTPDKNETRLITVNARTGKTSEPTTVKGQVTSAVPTERGIVAAQGNAVVKVGKNGRTELLTRTDNVPFNLSLTAEGGIAFLDRQRTRTASAAADGGPGALKSTSEVKYLPPGGGKPRVLVKGNLTDFDLTRSADGTAIVTGKAKTVGTLPESVRNPGGIQKDAVASTKGRAATKSAWADGRDHRIRADEYDKARSATISLHHLPTGNEPVMEAHPEAATLNDNEAAGTGVSPTTAGKKPGAKAQGEGSASSGATTSGVSTAASATSIAEPESVRTCSVERGNPEKQAFQPKPRQIEWAVNRAIEGTLDQHVYRPADWKNMGMGSYRPQALVGGLTPLSGGGRIPAQVFLGITAQESNMWQATRYAAPGTTANSLIGNYYGLVHDAHGGVDDPWAINWREADCGYGITQVTDGMRLPNKPYPDGTVRPSKPRAYQEAVALDYTANVAGGVNILAEKWNQTRNAGMVINNGDPAGLENWFFALWAYNSGFYPQSQAGENDGQWGVGWANNPANPTYRPNRTPFLENAGGGDDYSHAAEPQYWPYPEKVLGWAARPLEALEEPGKMVHGYRAAWWTSSLNRTTVKPPADLFCTGSNQCDPSKIGDGASNDSPATGPCQRTDWKCWWSTSVEWKSCEAGQCGHELFRFNDTYPEEADGNSHPPRCSDGLPSGTVVVDNVNSGTQLAGSNARRCSSYADSDGTFAFDFSTASGRMNTHQIGAGRGNHLWFSTTRTPQDPDASRMKVTGTWTAPTSVSGWNRVLVHMPSIAARSQQAKYTVYGTDSSSPHRVAPQRIRSNEWRSLGAFKFTGQAKVSLSNITREDGRDIAWDAVAFQPLGSKPTHVVGMGDSFASGEGASPDGGDSYYPETDYREDVGSKIGNGCHRSEHAWVRQAKLPGRSESVGSVADRYGNIDLSFVACSGARTYNIWSGGKTQYNSDSLPQVDLGYLDQNTDMVTIAIGGNDSLFVPVIKECIYAAGLKLCQDAEIDKEDPDTGEKTGEKTGPLKDFLPGWITDQVKPRIVKVLNQIKTRAPNAEIVLVGYPPLLSGNGQCIPGIGTEEAPWLNDVVAPHLADEMGNAAAAVGATFVNPAAEFEGKAICGDPESINGIVLSGKAAYDNGGVEPSMKSFHPKVSGARLYADALERVLG
ncbi:MULTISPECIES: golvesin C-terminal-like domain-containing protein [unclassified Streptomyces]|uniref:golvesin C-terminal-like domain-containing protein n=1 Tax=unclassified Streptomyces TaxID=2593676 RepID=UPI00234B3F4E|nr:GDSL-type esterase/lipase family protein [Streptomyces sp. M92]WCN03350.1 GDSL-type esterase/lipase family protein [Streptomyces sp. M92]